MFIFFQTVLDGFLFLCPFFLVFLDQFSHLSCISGVFAAGALYGWSRLCMTIPYLSIIWFLFISAQGSQRGRLISACCFPAAFFPYPISDDLPSPPLVSLRVLLLFFWWIVFDSHA
jgi:hypothetical protein